MIQRKGVIFLILIGIVGIASILLITKEEKTIEFQEKKQQPSTNTQPALMHLNAEQFKNLIFNYEAHNDWKYLGSEPALIEFYADWCGPCRQMAPVLKKLAVQYKNEINVYKINVDNERELATLFRVQSIPTFLFIPLDQEPYVMSGYMNEETLNEQMNKLMQ